MREMSIRSKSGKRTGHVKPGVEPGMSLLAQFHFLPNGDEVSLPYGILMMMRSVNKEHGRHPWVANPAQAPHPY